jgi:hypothetical protein
VAFKIGTRDETETASTVALIARESHVIVSSLARLEAFVHVHGRLAAKTLAARAARRLSSALIRCCKKSPMSWFRARPASSRSRRHRCRLS